MSIITLFVAVIICNLKGGFFKILRLYIVKGPIISNSKNTMVEVCLLVFFFLKSFFRFFLSLLRDFYISRKIIYRLELLDFFRFFNFRILHSNILDLYFSSSNINKIILLLGLVVWFQNIRNKLKTCLSLSVNYFLNYLFLSIQFSTFLLYLNFYWEFKTFSKEFNEIKLF